MKKRPILLPHLLLLITLFITPLTISANPLLLSTNSTVVDPGLPTDLLPEQVGDFVAPLNESQVRNLT